MATSFGAATEAYEAGRPSYPDEAVAWMVAGLPAGATVIDVGAGTGKLTRSLVDAGFSVTAVDPDAEMLAALAGSVAGVETVVGSAEELPLPDGSADAVVLGQAWHWVDPVRASAEIGRVVGPGGRLGLIWNIRDERTDWVLAMSELINRSAAERLIIAIDGVGVEDPFEPAERNQFEWSRPMTRSMIEQMVASRSYYLTGDDERRARIDHDLAALLDTRPELADGGTIALPYVTHAFRAQRV